MPSSPELRQLLLISCSVSTVCTFSSTILKMREFLTTYKRNLMSERNYDNLKDIFGVSSMKVEAMLNMPLLNITRTCTVTNKHLLALYELKKAETTLKLGRAVDEHIMFFACSALQAYHVAKHNFDWRKSRAGNLGAGVAFSPDPKYATFMCRTKVPDMAIIIVKVCKGKCYRGYSFVDFPPQDYDTTCDKDGKVFVKYHDNEFLPIHVVFFDRPDDRLAKQYFKNFTRIH